MEPAKDLIWWRGKSPHEKIVSALESIGKDQSALRANDEHHLRLYSDNEWRSTYGGGRAISAARSGDSAKNRLSLNVVRNMVNAATAMICRSRPYVSFLTDGGDWALHLAARKRERFVQAHIVREKIHIQSQRAVKNACIFGLGAIQVMRSGKRISLEVVGPGELFVDEQEANRGSVRSYYRVRLVDRETLKARFPGHKQAIDGSSGRSGYWSARGSNQVVLIDAWHLPSEPGAKDGVHITCTDKATLAERPYRWENPPFAIFRWEEEPFGFFGTGIPAELAGIQLEINTLLRLVQQNMWTGGNLKVLLEKGSAVPTPHISNDVRGTVLEYEGQPPIFHTHDVVSPQILDHLRYLVDQAYNVTGISQLSAQSQTPFASMSGRARLVHQNSESLRFKTQTDRYEDFFNQAAMRILEAATDIADNGHGAEVVIFKDREYLETITYDDVRGEPEDFENFDIQVWSSSQLPQTVAGRLSIVEQLLKDGMVDQRRALQLLDLPDLHGEMDISNAPYNLCERHIAQIVYEGETTAPSPALNLDYALQRVTLEIARCELRRGIPEERIDLLRDWKEAIVDLIEMRDAPAPAPGDPAMGMDPALAADPAMGAPAPAPAPLEQAFA